MGNRRLIIAVVVAAALGSAGPANASVQATAGPTITYVDCSAAHNGNGSIRSPLNSLAAANARWLHPGDQMLFRRTTVCTGMYSPRGGGTLAAPVTIGPYGVGPDGALDQPRIDAAGQSDQALYLHDISNIVVQGLHFTNVGNQSGVYRGVYVAAENRLVHDVTLSRLTVTDVTSSTEFNDHGKAGGGIILQVLGASPARFAHITIGRNEIFNVGRSGIFVLGIKNASGAPRPPASQPWPAASTGILIRNNRVQHITGDGIVTDATQHTVISHNMVSDGNLSGSNFADPQTRNCSAGIWAFNANNTMIDHNWVENMNFGKSDNDGCDGTAFDVDYNQDGTVIQDNFSNNNRGGFLLLCSDDQPRHAIVRYNISIDDGPTISEVPCKAPSAIGGLDGVQVYNNTIVGFPETSAENVPLPALYGTEGFLFENNILYARDLEAGPFACGGTCSNNLFYQLPPAGRAAIFKDPQFRVYPAFGQIGPWDADEVQLLPSSPALHAGVAVPGAPAHDYFGDPIAAGAPPSIGAAEQ
ncbi:MAG: right-handed parallel beta-helix repeat-containing protein [Frankiaceae bacterium]|nr:right-handed parallel beta-helix repeat-containing protein [Frankiaceae bacterium]MBV9870572.1 right-handed parallel beta-helix repeat-containing protein [Frankiaceae bacterium]